MDITQGDFDYFKSKLLKDKGVHEDKFLTRIDPDLIDRYFEGTPGGDDQFKSYNKAYGGYIGRIGLNNIFPTTATLIEEFYPQNPRWIGIPKREGDEITAAIAASAMNYYYNEIGAEEENQKCILSAWKYGIGYTKQGWRTVFRKNEAVNINPDLGNGPTSMKYGGIQMEEERNRDYIAEEGPFIEFVNPKDLYLDSEKPLGKGRIIHQHIPKTLYEIRSEGIYILDDDFYSRFKTGKNERDIPIDLYEQWIWMRDGIYLLVTVDGWRKPLRYDKMPYVSEGFPFQILTLLKEVNELYPPSHMKVAVNLQRFEDYILTLWKEHIRKHKNTTIYDGKAFDDTDRAKINNNEIGLNLFTKEGKVPSVAAQSIGSTPIPRDLFAVQEVISQNIKEILSVVGARRSGASENETLGQEQIADYGNQLRSEGIKKHVRSFLKKQGKRFLQDLKQFATAPSLFKVTGLNLIDPESQQPVTEKWVEFNTDRAPELLKDVIPQDLDIDLDITDTSSRNMPVIRKQLQEFVQGTVIPLIPKLQTEGKSFNAYRFIKKMGESFETIDNFDQFFDDIQMPAPIQPGLPGQGLPPGVNAPAPEDITQQAEEIRI